MSTSKKIIAILGGALVGGLGVAAIVYPNNSALFGGISGAIGILIAAITGISLVKGS
jgi:hypothetical protein